VYVCMYVGVCIRKVVRLFFFVSKYKMYDFE